ncbi:tetratricopeptide repeat protein [bacterium]|nr:tetratricopeptide repeat protein [bacterium]
MLIQKFKDRASIIYLTLAINLTFLLSIATAVTNSHDVTPAANLLQAADSLYAADDWETALVTYLSAAELFAQAGEWPGQAEALSQAGMIQYDLYDLDGALQNWQQAATLFDTLSDARGFAVTLKQIGWIYDDMADFKGALGYYQDAYRIAKEVADSSLQAQFLNNIGIAYYNLSDFDAAQQTLNQSLLIRTELDDHRGAIKTLNSLGMVFDAQSDHEAALRYYEQSLSLCKQTGDAASESQVLGNIGLVHRVRSDYMRALEYYQVSLKLKRSTDDKLGQAITLNNIGVVYDLLGNQKSALEYYQESLSISQEINDLWGQGEALDNIGSAYKASGKPDSALAFYQQSLELKTDLGNLRGQGITNNNIGLIYAAIGESEKAREYFQIDMEICRTLEDHSGTCVTSINLGLLDAEQGNYTAAESRLQEVLKLARQYPENDNYIFALTALGRLYCLQGNDPKAELYYKPAIDSLEVIRGKLESAEFKTGLFNQTSDFYSALIGSLFRQGKSSEAFDYSERARARTFLDILASGETAVRQSLQEKMLDSKEGSREPDLLSDVSIKPLTLPEIQNLIPDETVLLEYFIAEDQTYIWLITNSEFHPLVVDIDENSLTSQVKGYRSAILYSGAANVRSRRLYDLLIAPAAPYLQQHIILVPHGILHYLPFAALQNEVGIPLADKFTISHLPSASVLKYLQLKESNAMPSFLGLGNPEIPDPAMEPLPYAEAEVKNIAKLFKSQEVFTGKNASEEIFKQRCPDYELIHLACHTDLNAAYPLFSKLLLTPSQKDDGEVMVHEIFGLRLNARLVALSGCQTGLGHLTNGDELVGLTRAFLFAGTGTVLSSYWPVEDSATAFFMKSFYINVRNSGLAEALQIAQKETRVLYPESSAWASFFLVGNPD